jgi:hypothetical protein
MKTNMRKIGAALLALALFGICTEARAQTTTVTTTRGAFTQFVPNTETLVVRSDTSPNPLQYTVTKQTTVVDQSGAPIAIDQIAPGVPLSVQYTTAGDRLVASRIIVQRPTHHVVEQRTTTTTTTTRPLTHDEKEAIEEQREERKDAIKEQIEQRKKALEKAEDALDDDDGD